MSQAGGEARPRSQGGPSGQSVGSGGQGGVICSSGPSWVTSPPVMCLGPREVLILQGPEALGPLLATGTRGSCFKFTQPVGNQVRSSSEVPLCPACQSPASGLCSMVTLLSPSGATRCSQSSGRCSLPFFVWSSACRGSPLRFLDSLIGDRCFFRLLFFFLRFFIF